MKFSSRPLTCDEACEMMFDSIDGELDKEAEKLLSEHITCCESCRRELAERREMLSLIKLSGHDAPDSLYSGVMEKIAHTKKERTPIFARLKFLPAAALVTACAALTVFVVGRGYILGMGSSDNVADAAEITVGSTAPERTAVTYAETEAILYTADGAVPEVAPEAVLYDVAEADEEVYTATTAALTASAPLMISNYSEFSRAQSVNEPAEAKIKAASVAAGGASPLADTFAELDKLYYKLSMRVDNKAILICSEEDLDMGVIGEEAISGSETVSVQGSEFIRYIIENDAAKHFSELLELLDAEGSSYRAAIPEDGEIASLELCVLTASEK